MFYTLNELYYVNATLQDLTVTITSERPDTEIDIIPDENEMSGINVQTFVDQQVGRSLSEHYSCYVIANIMSYLVTSNHSRCLFHYWK